MATFETRSLEAALAATKVLDGKNTGIGLVSITFLPDAFGLNYTFSLTSNIPDKDAIRLLTKVLAELKAGRLPYVDVDARTGAG